MGKSHLRSLMFLVAGCLLVLVSGCVRRPSEVWDDTKTCTRHMARGINKLAGKNCDSRQISSREEFMGWQESRMAARELEEYDYVPMVDDTQCREIAMLDVQQPRETPGDVYSSIPGIEAFKDPSTISGAKGIFHNVQFDYNSNLVKGNENMEIIYNVAEYLKRHPGTYVFVEGHCDERGPEAYNLALGTKRSNAVRNMLVQQGASGEHIFTISYGKERPLVATSNEKSWAANRRVEFKIYNR